MDSIFAASRLELPAESIVAIVAAVIGGFGVLGTAIGVLWRQSVKNNREQRHEFTDLKHRANKCDKDRERLSKWSSQQDIRIARLDTKVKVLEGCSHEQCPFKVQVARRVREDVSYLNPDCPTEPIPPYGQSIQQIP